MHSWFEQDCLMMSFLLFPRLCPMKMMSKGALSLRFCIVRRTHNYGASGFLSPVFILF